MYESRVERVAERSGAQGRLQTFSVVSDLCTVVHSNLKGIQEETQAG